MGLAMTALRFGAFELDPDAGELRRQGRLVHLAAQPRRALSLLVTRAGEVVTRDELRQHIWGDSTFVEFDRSLNFCIASVRAVLHDDARSPRFIETLPRCGYRFLADVHRAEDPAREGAKVAALAAVPPRRIGRWAVVAALPALLAQVSVVPRAHTRATAATASMAAFGRGMREMGEGAEGRRRGIPALREAIRIDPRFAEAYYQLGTAYLDLAADRQLPAGTALAEAQAAAERAVALEPIAETRQLLGVVRLLKDWDWSGAEHDLAAAVRLEPSWDGGLVSYARLLSARGDDAFALRMIDRAEAQSPTCDLLLLDSAMIRYRARHYEEALFKLESADRFGPPRGLSPKDWKLQILWLRTRIRLGQGNWAEAQRAATLMLRLHDYSRAAQERFARGEPRETMRLFLLRSAAMMEPLAEAGRIPPTRLASVHAWLAQAEPALKWLWQAAAERDPELVYELRSPDYDALRSDASFEALYAQVMGDSSGPHPPFNAALMARLTTP
jgi:DNA-binding winged helix-turn-helix (wHTH) protein